MITFKVIWLALFNCLTQCYCTNIELNEKNIVERVPSFEEGICNLSYDQIFDALKVTSCPAQASQICSSDDCIKKQQCLIECIAVEEVGSHYMEGIAELIVNQAMVQWESNKKEIEIIVADMINVAHRLNNAIGLYYELTLCANKLAKDLKDARVVVQEKAHCVNEIRRHLCKVRAALETSRRQDAIQRLNSNNKIKATCCDCTTYTPSPN